MDQKREVPQVLGVIKKIRFIHFKGLIFTLVIVASLYVMTLYTKTYMYQDEILRLSRDFITLEEKLDARANNWVHYLEKRVNSLAQRQDEYQTSTFERLRILEQRMDRLESSVLANKNKNININNVNVR